MSLCHILFCRGGVWLSLCGHVWDIAAAEVLCRSLGLGEPLTVTYTHHIARKCM